MIDALMSRIAAGTVVADDLRAFAAEAQRGAVADWGDLAAGLRAEFVLARGARRVAAVAHGTEMPPPVRARWALAGSAGWLAAVLAIAALGWTLAAQRALRPSGAGAPGAPAHAVPAGLDDANDALDRYLALGRASGRVLGELPPETVDVRPAADGVAAEVVFIRRVLERTEVDTAVRLASDELGRATIVPTSRAAPPRRDSM